MFSYFSPFKQLLLKKSLKSVDNSIQKNPKPIDTEKSKSSLFVKKEEDEEDDDSSVSDNSENDSSTSANDSTSDTSSVVEPKKRIEDACIVIKDIPFFYLDNSTDINRDMSVTSYLKEQNITKIEVHIGIYTINKTNYAPFLTYGLNENNKLLAFPHFTYEVLNNDDDKEEPCIEECKLQILSLFHIYPDSNIHKINDFFNKKMIYNGYIHNNQNNIDELLIVFEYKEEEEVESKKNKNKLQWATIHEIVNTKKIIQQPIPILYKWFLQIPDLMYMTDIYDTVIDIPFVLYSLEEDDEVKEFYSITKRNIIPPFIFKPKFGMKYFFSNNYIAETLEENSIITDVDRYVVFLTKTLYILDENEMETKESISKYNSIYFQQDGEPIWAVSSVDFFTKLHL